MLIFKRYYIIFLILCFFACSKNNSKESSKINILTRIAEISSKTNNNFSGINNYSHDSYGNIYIYDDNLKEIFIYDLSGEYVDKFGCGGNGPGEFKSITSIINSETNIILIDSQKSSVIKYDINRKFIAEKKTSSIHTQKAIDFKNNILAWYTMYSMKGNKMFRKRGLAILSDSLTIIKDIYSQNSEFDPYLINPNNKPSIFSINRQNGDIAVSSIDSDKFIIYLFDKDFEKKKELKLKIPPVEYSKETWSEINNFFRRQYEERTKLFGNKFKMENLSKYTRLVKDIAYDDNSNLWILSPNKKNPDKVDIYIFDKQYSLKDVYPTNLPMGKISIINDILLFFSGTEAEDRKIEIFKIGE